MRAKIILPNLLVVLVFGLVSYFLMTSKMDKDTQTRIEKQLATTGSLFARSEALRGYELLFDVRKQAMSKDVTQAFAPVDVAPKEGQTEAQVEAKIRQEWFRAGVQAVEMYTELWIERGDKKPQLVFITDRNGVVIARNTTPNACPAGKNVSGAIKVVERALDGEATYSLWSVENSPLGTSAVKDDKYCALMNSGLLEMAAAPIWVGDDVAGALVIGFEVSNGVAKIKKEKLGLDVAVLVADSIYSSSFKTDTARQNLDQQLKNVASDKVTGALDSGHPSKVFALDIEGANYLAMVLPSMNSEKKDRIANVIMGSVDDASDHRKCLVLVLAFLGIAAVLVIVIGMLLGKHFLKPVVQIEEGLLKVINGEFEYRLDVKSTEVGGLGYRINQLISVLTGEDEEEENGSENE
jgi:hypothetical protein